MVKAVIDTLDDLYDHNRWSAVKSVTLRVGAMRQVIPHILSFAFKASVAGSRLEGAELVIVPVPIDFLCHSCGGKWGEEDLGYLCPHCGSKDVDMVEGMEMDLESLEVEE